MANQVETAMEKRRKMIEGFEKCKATLDGMGDNEKKIQQEKVLHFLRIVRSLTKHFSIWASIGLLFLSVLLEQKIATYIVLYMYEV